MKKLVWLTLLVCFFFITSGISGAKTGTTKLVTFPDLVDPQSMSMDEDQVYIVDGHEVFIYSLNDFSLLRIFGKAGDEPDAFKSRGGSGVQLIVNVQSDNIVISSEERVSIFSKRGDFIEILTEFPQMDYIVPFGQKYIGSAYEVHVGTGKSVQHFFLMDDAFDMIKDLAQSPLGGGSARGFGGPDRKMHIDLAPPYFGFKIFENRIYVANTHKGFFIEVFDSDGEKLYEINRNYEKRKITETYRQKRELEIQNRPFYRRYKDFVVIDETEHIPAFRNFAVTDRKIYTYTYESEKTNQEIVVLDLEGNHLFDVHVPFADCSRIHKSKYYFLVLNGDDEWELHVLPIEEQDFDR